MQFTLVLGGNCYTHQWALVVWIKNTGEGDAGDFVVDANGFLQTIAGLHSGESSSAWFTHFTNPTTAMVDPYNNVVESNENNNQLTQQLPIPTQPPADYYCTPTLTPTWAVPQNFYLPIIVLN